MNELIHGITDSQFRKLMVVAQIAVENTGQCLEVHMETLGRSTRKNAVFANMLERELVDAKEALLFLEERRNTELGRTPSAES